MAIPPAAASPMTETLNYVPANFWFFTDHTSIKHVYHLPKRQTSFYVTLIEKRAMLHTKVSAQFEPKTMMEFRGEMPEIKQTTISVELADKIEKVAKDRFEWLEKSDKNFSLDSFFSALAFVAPGSDDEDEVKGNEAENLEEAYSDEEIKKRMEAKLGPDVMKAIEESSAVDEEIRNREKEIGKQFLDLVESEQIVVEAPVYN